MIGNALVIGGTGLLGYGVVHELNKSGWNVRTIGIDNLFCSDIFPSNVEYLRGDFYDESFLLSSLDNIDKVFFFLSTTFPSTSSDSLELEFSKTLSGLDYLIRKMREVGINEIVFPSSGGTVYGNIESGFACETDTLKPTTPYGVGKMMCENVLQFYSQFGISSTILRIGNVYGSPLSRNKMQGVIEVFIQKALRGETATVWGDSLTNVRDYIFMDDFAKAVAIIAEHKPEGVDIYNLSSGIGITLEEIIHTINKHVEEPLKIKFVERDATSTIKRIVLDTTKIKKITGWKPEFDIDTGIYETIMRKQSLDK